MNLQISPKNLCNKLLHSAYLRNCTEPTTAISNLQSDSDYADYNCLFIFSRDYNQNICVHFHYLDNTGKEQITFCHYKVNNTQHFIHLHLANVHYTPYVKYEQLISENVNDTEQMEDLFLENNSDTEMDNSVNANIVDETCNNNDAIEIDETIPIYTNFKKHYKGHIHFNLFFKKNEFGHSCKVCDRLWWKNDMKQTDDKHYDILQIILTVLIQYTFHE